MSERTDLLAFGTALASERNRAGLTQAELGARIGDGYGQVTVSEWERGKTACRPRDVEQIEDVLELQPGTLTKHLGFLPMKAAGKVIERDLIDAILADPDLNDAGRQAMLATYRALAGLR